MDSARLPSIDMESSLQLLFDDSFAAKVDELRDWLFREGIVRSVDPCPPHVTLAVGKSALAADRAGLLESVEKDVAGTSLSFASWGLFPSADGYVLFLSPVASPSFLEAHARAFRSFSGIANELEAHYEPRAFVPHVTIGTGIAASDLTRAISHCAATLTLPCDATIERCAIFAGGSELPAGE